MGMERLGQFFSSVFFGALCLLALSAQGQTHKGISFQGVIKLPGGEFPTRSGISVNARILSTNDCILREEQFTGVNIANGYINLAVGTSNVVGYDPGFSMKKAMDNSAPFTGLVCLSVDGSVNSGVTTFNPATSNGGRKLRVSMVIDSVPIVADFNMRAMPFAVNAESLNGKSDANFINTSTNITQASVEAWFAGSLIGQLNAGTYNAPTATSAVTAQGLAASYVVPLTQGGTGATSATAARASLGLGSLATLSPSGTASASTYLRGDGSWQAITSGVSSVAGKTGVVTLEASDISDFNAAADARITTQKAANNGLATLDTSGKVPSSQLALTTSDIPGLSTSHITAGTFADSMLAGLSVDKLLNGSNKYFNYKPNSAACADNEVLKYDSTLLSGAGGWKCATDSSGLSSESDPTVQAYAKNVPSTGLKITANQLAADFGTGAGKVVEGNDSRVTGAFATSTTLSGDLSGTLPSPVVEKIKSQSISAAGSAAGQVLRYAGGNTWTPNFVSMSDLRSSVTGSAALTGTGCTADQTLSWSSATDSLSCIAISITKSQVSDFPTLATSATTDTTNATNITSGTLNTSRLPASVTDALWTASGSDVYRLSGRVGLTTASPAGYFGNTASNLGDTGTPSVASGTGVSAEGMSWAANSMGYVANLFNSSTGNYAHGLQVYTQNATATSYGLNVRTASNNILVARGDGRVGIGTGSPAATLDVRGSVAFGSSKGYLSYYYVASAYDQAEIGATGSTTSLSLVTNGVSRLNITPAGRVGIGNTAPTQTFSVGSAGDGNTAVANAWNTFSDRRLKERIQRIPNACDAVDQLNGYYYYWKKGADQNRQVGVIAQEVEAVFPELVKTGDDDIKTVDYPKLTAVLIEANKELNARTKQQQSEIEKLQADSAALKAWICAKDSTAPICL